MRKSKGEAGSGGGSGRSKNRASSSSFAATMGTTGGGPMVGFGGYLGSSRIEPASITSDDSTPLPDVDSEMLQHLKRLGRKDPTTKLKALTSLSVLCTQKRNEEIAQILPQWAFGYKQLLLDYNREVRRATHETMANLVTTVRKGLAPHLKSLMGPWWFSQFDPAPEVAQAARHSFEAAFPQSERRLDALMMCVKEIFLYLDENLKLTPQALSDKAMPMDELEDMHQRVISSSLLAIATLVEVLLGVKFQNHDSDSVTTEQKALSKVRATILSSAETAFSMHKFFLNFFKSKSAVVRSATYSVLTSYIKHVPQVFNEENMKIISPAILGAFQEKDASCHSSMWDMIILFPKKFPESWSHCNIQKVVLNRFWQFLQNGCYGSRQVSYPLLIQFLESIPLKAVAGEQVVFNFLQNLWEGRNPRNSLAPDSLAFFSTFRLCFLSLLNNTSRYSSGDSSNNLAVRMVNNVLVKLLWGDYVLLLHPQKQQAVPPGQLDESAGDDAQISREGSLQTNDAHYPLYYLRDLGNCIIGILSDISLKDCLLLDVFLASFRRDFLEIIHQRQHLLKFEDHVEQIISFFLSLDELVVQKGQSWPLECLAKPLVMDSLPLIRSIDNPSLVRLLSVLAEIFGPVTIFSEVARTSDGDISQKSRMELYLQSFNDDFVPWCLNGNSSTSSPKLDLLLSLIQEAHFFYQWSSIITYAAGSQKQSRNTTVSESLDQFELLAMLLDKVRERIRSSKLGNLQKNGSQPEHWQHDLLDFAAISLACTLPTRPSSAHFLCSALGGTVQDDQICFLSREAVMNVLGTTLESLASVLTRSTFGWVKASNNLLFTESESLKHLEKPSLITRYEVAHFAFEVIEGSIYLLRTLDEDSNLVPSILAALFVIEWECSMASLATGEYGLENGPNDSDDDASALVAKSLEDYSDDEVYLKLDLVERIFAFHQRINTDFWSSLGSTVLSRLQKILVQIVRSAIFETKDLSIDRVSTLCSQWVMDMSKTICVDHMQLQSLLDLLLSEGEYWPLWVRSCLDVNIQFDPVFTNDEELKHSQFVAFVEKLILSLGFNEVILGVPEVPDTTASRSLDDASLPRAWLVAEILYTWKWPGGNALSSFLPSLVKYMKVDQSHDINVISSLLKILLDGALVHGTKQCLFFNAWHLSDNEVDKIQDPFLRALAAFLFTANVKDNIWRKSNAVLFFENLSSKLYVGSTVNRPCLRVIPFVMSIIIQTLFKTSELDEPSSDACQLSSDDGLVGKNILSWLHAAISCLSPSPGELVEQDVEDWNQVVLSCFPLKVVEEHRISKVEVPRDISDEEKSLLLALFRKYQVLDDLTTATPSTGTTTIPESIQLMEMKVMAVSVGYCWTKLEKNDWNFVYSKVKKCIESFVLLVEELAEGVDSAVINYKSTEESLEKTKLVIQHLDPLAVSIAEAALVTLILLKQLVDLEEVGRFEVLQNIRLGKFADSGDEMMGSILRLFLATGVTEAIGNSCSEEAVSVIASNRLANFHFWALVASFVSSSPPHIKSSAVETMELWGLSKGSVSGLYAILFSPHPISYLQFAAYIMFLSEPVSQLSLLKESCLKGTGFQNEPDLGQSFEFTSQETVCLREEISTFIQMPSSEVLKMDLVAQERVNVLIAWALLLSQLQLLPSSSTTREKVIQHIQDSVSSAILDCIFQHIPLKIAAQNLKKKDAELGPEAYGAAKACMHAITTGSLLPYVESLWPISTEKMASLAGAIYGMMIRLLPSYVRTWFTSLRDRSLSNAIESFTKAWCSPPLLMDEFSQVKSMVYADENFSVSVSKSNYEIVATYKKEETGMDLVIHLPNCYPLRHVDVECTRSLGISEVKQRKWLLSLTAFVRNQNGAIAEAIRVWKSNFDKEFEGVEECPICYSILHTNNHSLPRLACKTCRHKFHAACLYKWFSTSNKSTCPLCQTPF